MAKDETKVRKPRGESKPKPLHMLYRVTDYDGNTVEGVKVEILVATRNAAKALQVKQDNPDTQLGSLTAS